VPTPRTPIAWTYPTPLCANRLCKANHAFHGKQVGHNASRNYVIIRSVRARRNNEYTFYETDVTCEKYSQVYDTHHSRLVIIRRARDMVNHGESVCEKGLVREKDMVAR